MTLVHTRSNSFLSDCLSILRQYPMAAAVGAAASVLAATAIVNGQLARKAQRDNPPKGKFIEIDGVRLHYVERGNGRPLVLFHGNGSMIQDFESSGLIDLAAGNYKVIVTVLGSATACGRGTWCGRRRRKPICLRRHWPG
jgi:hypothetical protein